MSALLKIFTWTPSRFAKWKECPAKVKYEDILKTCPKCFKGRVSGGYDGTPVVCDTCDKPQPDRAPLERGSRMDEAVTFSLAGPVGSGRMDDKDHVKLRHAITTTGPEAKVHLAEALRHPKIAKLQKKLAKTKGLKLQDSIVLGTNKWNRVSQFTKNAWARLKLDALYFSKGVAKIVDWKSGNIDKNKMEIREKDDYYDSMRAYQMAVLSVYPEAKAAEATMVFLDAPPKLEDPFKSLPVLKLADLNEARAKWEQKIRPMMSDTIFAPRPGYYCSWCPFSKREGGPCPH